MNELLNREFVYSDINDIGKSIYTQPIFVINDIELPIAPLNIAVQKEDLAYKYKTLRTKATTKIGSGRGVYNLQLTFVFPHEMLLMLHRLIIQIRNCPFVYIKNDYIRSAVSGLSDRKSNIFFTVTNFHIRSHDKSPNAFLVNLDLRYFNYQPYAENLVFKKDLWTKNFKSNFQGGEGGENTQLTIPVFDRRKPTVKTNFQRNETLTTSRRDFNNLIGQLEEDIKEFEDYGHVAGPTVSNIYVRYYNQLQIKSLEENFGISAGYVKGLLGEGYKNYEEGKRVADGAGAQTFVAGIHSKYLPISIRNDLVQKMLKGFNSEEPENFTNFKYHKYKYSELSSGAIRYLKELLESENGIQALSGPQLSRRLESGRTIPETRRVARGIDNLFIRDPLPEISQEPTIYPVLQSSLEICPIQRIAGYNKYFILYSPVDNIRVEESGNDLILKVGNTYKSIIREYDAYISFYDNNKIFSKGNPIGIISLKNESKVQYSVRNPKNVLINNLFQEFITKPEIQSIPLTEEQTATNKYIDEIQTALKKLNDENSENVYYPVLQEFVSNVFQSGVQMDFYHSINIETVEDLTASKGTVTAVSAGFANLISSIPITEYEHPTHQFLGSMEPSYTMNIVSKDAIEYKGATTDIFLMNTNQMQSTLSRNSRLFKEVYDSGNLRIRTFLTKLLGTYKVQKEGEKEKKNCIIDSVTTETVEGLPGVSSTIIRFSETNSINDEKIEAADTRKTNTELEARYKNAYYSALSIPTRKIVGKAPVVQNEKRDKYSWRTKYFNADIWYAEAEGLAALNFNRRQLTEFQDSCGYNLCLLLDKIQDAFPKNRVEIRDSYNVRASRTTHHNVNCAVDIVVHGEHVVNVVDMLLIGIGEKGPLIAEGSWTNFIYDKEPAPAMDIDQVGIGIYGKEASLSENKTVKMDGTASKGMIHIDLNIKHAVVDKRDTTVNTAGLTLNKGRRWLGEGNPDPDYKWETTYFRWSNRLISGPDNDADPNDDDNVEAREQIRSSALPQEFIAELNDESENLDIIKFKLREYLESQGIGDIIIKQVIASIEANPQNDSYAISIYGVSPEGLREFRDLEIDDQKLFIQSYDPVYNDRTKSYEFGGRISERRIRDIISLSSRGESLATSRELVEVLKMIQNFKKFAEFILAEPEIYKNKDEVAAEKTRISKELLDIDLDPKGYGILLSVIASGGNDGSSNGEVNFEDSVNFVSTHLKEIKKGNEVGITSIINPDLLLFQNEAKFSQALIEVVSYILEYSGNDFDFLKPYKEAVNNLRTYSDIAQILNTRLNETSEGQLNIFSEGMLGRDIEELIYGIHGYRCSGSNVPDSSITDTVGEFLSSFVTMASVQTAEANRHGQSLQEKINLDRQLRDVLYNRKSRADYNNKINKWANSSSLADNYVGENSSIRNMKWDILFGKTSGPFFNKKIIEQRQNEKIAYLRRLLFSLVSKLISNDVFREYANIEVTESLFKIDLGTESAYPDLDLPTNPISISSDRFLDPGFFFHKLNSNLDVDFNRYSSIFDNSVKFMNYLQSGLYAGSVEKLVQAGQGTLLRGEQVNLSDLIIDTHEGRTNPKPPPAASLSGDANTIAESERNIVSGHNNQNYFGLTEQQITSYSQESFQKEVSELFGRNHDSNQLVSAFERSSASGQKEGKKALERIGAGESDLSAEDTQSISNQINRDIRKQRKRIEEAYPTFKFYIIEEDATDSESYFVFDDFYSYNSVLDFTIHKSRKLAADTAVIRLQNISGSLDGTKRNVKRDIDIEKEFEELGFVENTVNLSSVVLRPGINAQLRAGYSSNPNKLDILISGRIADISYSNQTDMIEVTLQSFGYELETKKYGGMNSQDRNVNYYSTRSLLAKLILDESLMHFGRYKVGRIFQLNENADNTFVKNKRIFNKSWNFNWTSSVLDTVNSTNFLYATAAITGFLLAKKLGPVQKLLSRAAPSTQRILPGMEATLAETTSATLKGLGAALVNGYKSSRVLNTSRLLATSVPWVVSKIPGIRWLIKPGGQSGKVAEVFSAYNKAWFEVGAIGLSLVAGLAVIETAANLVTGIGRFAGNKFDKWTTPNVKLLKLDPQDDNIFPPDESVYIDDSFKQSYWKEELSIAWETFMYIFDIWTFGIGAGIRESEQERINKFLKEPFKYFDKRLPSSLKAHVYNLNEAGGKTAWDIFHEMSLRHPGYVYAPRQYGDGLEYRMFFGLPTQRYWAKDINPSKAKRLNNIYTDLVSNVDIVLSKYFSAEKIRDMKRYMSESELQKNVKVYLAKEWKDLTEERFIPFRRFHSIDSSRNLIANQIRVSNEVINTVGVNFKQDGKVFTRTLKAHENLQDNQIKSIQINEANCISYQGALRYGISTLMNSAKEMYSGEIVVLGNPKINPYDTCILRDKYLDMYGPLEVEAVTHIFGHDTGFITEIKPNALVTANESITYPILNNLIFAEATKELEQKLERRRYASLSVEDRTTLVTRVINEVFDSEDFERLANIEDQEQKEALKQSIIEQFKRRLDSGDVITIQDIINQTGGTPEILNGAETGIDRLLYTIGGGLTIQSFISFARAARLSSPGGGFLSYFTRLSSPLGFYSAAAALVLYAYYENTTEDVLDSLRNPNGILHKKFVTGDMHLSRIGASQAMQIFPLYRHGVPLVASSFEDIDPKNIWKNRFGQIYNAAADALSGFKAEVDRYNTLGHEDIYDATFDTFGNSISSESIRLTNKAFGFAKDQTLRGYLVNRAREQAREESR